MICGMNIRMYDAMCILYIMYNIHCICVCVYMHMIYECMM